MFMKNSRESCGEIVKLYLAVFASHRTRICATRWLAKTAYFSSSSATGLDGFSFCWLVHPNTLVGGTGVGQMMVGHPRQLALPTHPSQILASDHPMKNDADPEPDFRILPPGRYGGIDLRAPRRQ